MERTVKFTVYLTNHTTAYVLQAGESDFRRFLNNLKSRQYTFEFWDNQGNVTFNRSDVLTVVENYNV